MQELILKYNARLTDKLPSIQLMVEKHQLKIELIEDVQESPSKLIKVVHVTGEPQRLIELDRELVRHAAITKKFHVIAAASGNSQK